MDDSPLANASLDHVTFADGRNPAQDLLSEGLVRAYDGGRKPQVFCAEE